LLSKKKVKFINFTSYIFKEQKRLRTMGERVSNERINRREGYLYYVGKDGYVWEVAAKYTGSRERKRVGTERVNKAPGYLYYVGSDGHVYRAKMNRGGMKGARRKKRRKAAKKAKATKKKAAKKRRR
jgi:hypothetical protein